MNRYRTFFLALLVLVLHVCGGNVNSAQAQSNPPANFGPHEDTASEWKLKVSKTQDICVGDIITLSFTGQVVDGHWHLYSAKGGEGIAYNPTVFVLFDDESKGVKKVGGLTENVKPRETYDSLMMGTLRDFKTTDVITFRQKIQITKPNVDISAELSYQICTDEGMCKFMRPPFTWKFKAKAKKECEEKGSEGNNGATNGDALGVNEGNGGSGDGNEGDNGSDAENLTASGDSSGGADTLALAGAGNENAGGTGAEAAALNPGNEVVLEDADKGCDAGALWGIFWPAFLFGFVALLTPCVFPMIPLTVSFFVKQSKNKSQGIRNAITYGLFIIFIYTVLGLLVTLAFGETFLYELSSKPIPNLIFFGIFFIFSLSFLGMFEITLPNSWANRLDSKADRGGIIGIFFMALTLTIVSFSCTGPIIGSLLVETAAGGGGCLMRPVVGMAGFGLSFAIPFGLFALFPGWLNSMPKSGGWLNSVKVVLGFLELALCMKFFSNADLSMHWHLLDREIFVGIWIVIFALLGIYLLGKLQLPHDSKIERLPVPRLILAVASFSFMMYLVPGLFGARLSMLEGLLPPIHNGMLMTSGAGSHGGGGSSGEGAMTLNGEICNYPDRKDAQYFKDRETHYCVFYDLDEALAYAKEKQKPLFVDFTGHSCANCRKMEQNVWPEPAVENLLRNEYVMVSLYVDEQAKLDEKIKTPEGKTLRTIGDKWLNLESTRYKKLAQPYYALLDYQGRDMVKPVGYTPDVEQYTNFLKSGLDEFALRTGKTNNTDESKDGENK